MLVGFALAQEPRAEATEASVKAAFLYKFAAYVDWPPGSFATADAPFMIGVMESQAVASELAKLVPGRSVAGHPIVARALREGESVKGVKILFVGAETGAQSSQVIGAGQKEGALVVTESANGLAAGSAINFVTLDDHVGFEVSIDGAQRSGHRISARMLSVARRVVQKGG